MTVSSSPKLGQGASLALASAVLFGASTPLAKLLLGDIRPLTLASLLYLGSGLGLALVRLLGRGFHAAPDEVPLRRADLPWLGVVVLAGGVLGPVLLLIGLSGTAASSAALLLNLEGVFTIGIAWVVFRENVDRRIALGACAILLGALLLSWDGRLSFGAGWPALAILAACLCWAVDNNLTRKISASDPLVIAMVKGLVAGAVNAALAAAQGLPWPGLAESAAAGLLGFFGYGVSLTFFVLALRHLGAARTGAYFATAPFIGALLGLALFAEPLTIPFVLAAALMILGLWLHLTEDHAHEHLHEAVTHEHRHAHDLHHRHRHKPGDPAGEPHAHVHAHPRFVHRHPHYPDLHHRHSH